MGNSLWTGISGLNAASSELDVISNNIANVNTIGFKSSKIYFADVLSQSISGGSSGSMQIGRGVSTSQILTQFGSGSFESTSNGTDVAIDGDGFFMVNDADGATYYTRAGAFTISSEGYLVDTNGYKVQGYNLLGGSSSVIDDIALENVQSSPSTSTTFATGVNLDAETAAGSSFNSAQTVYDSLGGEHTLNISFSKTADTGYWSAVATLDGEVATAQSATGLTFDSNGALANVYTSAPSRTVTHLGGTGSIGDITIDQPSQLAATGSAVTLTYNGTGWVVTANGGLASMTVSGDGTTCGINVNGASGDDITIDGAWTTGQTITFEIGAAATANTVCADYLSDIVLTRGASDDVWTLTDTGLHTDATVTRSGTNLLLDLNGDGTTDMTVPFSGTWAQGEQLVLSSYATTSSPSDISLTFGALSNGATIGTGNTLSWDLVGDTSQAITSYASASAIRALSNDGYASGILKSLSVDSQGYINGFFSNGKTVNIAQLVLAKFDNPWGLKRMGSNCFGETVTSGQAITNAPGTSGMGELKSNSLEMSNTDIATEFINMITAQKAYQANARVITTTDNMLSELMNIKR
jgi:flagellar hook protein FlgE